MAAHARRVPPAPPGFDIEAFSKGVAWYQRWEIFQGVFTPGVDPSRTIENLCDAWGLPEDLTGKRVLDIGAWNGCLSFECERRGAKEVIALGPENPEWSGFERVRRAIGSTRTRYVTGTVYDLDPARLGRFDVIFFSGVLYHLRYPLLGIDNLRRVSTGDVYVETFVCDDFFLYRERGGLQVLRRDDLPPALLAAPVWQFYRFDELGHDDSNWFGPTSAAVVQAFESAGFAITQLPQLHHQRGLFRAKVREGVPEFLAIRSLEGIYFDTIVGPLFGKDRLGLADEGLKLLALVLSSDGFYRRAGGTPDAWLDGVCRALLGRDAAAAERAAAPARAGADAAARLASVRRLVEGVEFRRRLVAGYYARILGREGTPAEVDSWVQFFQRGSTEEYVIAAFLASLECSHRHGGENHRWLEGMCRELLGCEEHPDGPEALESLRQGAVTRYHLAVRTMGTPAYRRHLLAGLCRRHLGLEGPDADLRDWLREGGAAPAAAAA